jgi:hypothetical protein
MSAHLLDTLFLMYSAMMTPHAVHPRSQETFDFGPEADSLGSVTQQWFGHTARTLHVCDNQKKWASSHHTPCRKAAPVSLPLTRQVKQNSHADQPCLRKHQHLNLKQQYIKALYGTTHVSAHIHAVLSILDHRINLRFTSRLALQISPPPAKEVSSYKQSHTAAQGSEAAVLKPAVLCCCLLLLLSHPAPAEDGPGPGYIYSTFKIVSSFAPFIMI